MKVIRMLLIAVLVCGVNVSAARDKHDEKPLRTCTFYFKLPLAQPQYHWKFVNKDVYLSGRLLMRIISEDQVNEIVIFEKGEIASGWKVLSTKRGPQGNSVYFGFFSTAKYRTQPSDKVELELMANEDLDGIGRLQTGTLKAGIHKAKGTLKIYDTSSDRAFVQWHDKWLLDITSEKGWRSSNAAFFINNNGTVRSLTNDEKNRLYASVHTNKRRFYGTYDISVMETIVDNRETHAINAGSPSKHFRKVRIRKGLIRKRIDITEYTDALRKTVQAETSLFGDALKLSDTDSIQRYEHTQKTVLIEKMNWDSHYDISAFGKTDPKIATTIRVMCYLFGNEKKEEDHHEISNTLGNTGGVDQIQLIDLSNKSVVYTLELDKEDWSACRKIQWYHGGGNTLAKTIEYTHFKKPVAFNNQADPGDSDYLLPHKIVRRYYEKDGNEVKHEILDIVDASMANRHKQDSHDLVRLVREKDFNIHIPDDYLIVDKRNEESVIIKPADVGRQNFIADLNRGKK